MTHEPRRRFLVTLQPPGRGRWERVEMYFTQGRNSPAPLFIHRGELLEIGGRRLKVVSVREAAA